MSRTFICEVCGNSVPFSIFHPLSTYHHDCPGKYGTPQRDSGDEDDFKAPPFQCCENDADCHKPCPSHPHFGTPVPDSKPSNPKDALGIMKAPSSVVPQTVMTEVGLGMLEGAMKYGRHNYRVIGVRASVYFDAEQRHMRDWWEGEDLDPDSRLSHITKAITTLVVLRDAMIQGMWVDDRPPPAPKGWLAKMNEHVKWLMEKYPNPVKPYTQK